MKNLLLKICLIAISVLVSTSTAYAVADDGSNVLSLDEQFFELLLADQQVTRPNIDPKKIWAQNKGDNRGQNMYMMILNEVDDKPFKDAIEELSTTISFPHSKTGEEVFFSQEDWKNIYVGRSMAPITQKLGLGINAANAYHSIMLSYVTQQVNSNEFVNNLRAKSMASTIFMDGDLTNSGFDLINDLDIIELILFGSIEEGPYDRALGSVGLPPRPTLGGENFTSASGEIITGDLSSESSGASTSSTVASVFPPADQSFADDEKEFPEATSKKAAMLYNPTGLHPLECETDNNIGEAVDDYIDDLPNGNKFEIPKPDKGDGEDSGDRDDSSETAEKDDSGDAKGDDDGHSVDDDAESSPEDTFDDIDPAKEYEWETPTLCNGIYCIEIIFANDEDGRGTYKANDNCIACHMEFLLANMERLLSKTLTPSKAPGNLFEKAKKDSLRSNQI